MLESIYETEKNYSYSKGIGSYDTTNPLCPVDYVFEIRYWPRGKSEPEATEIVTNALIKRLQENLTTLKAAYRKEPDGCTRSHS